MDTIFSESLRIVRMEGKWFFLAKVSHNEYPIPFSQTDVSHEKVVFENPQHDFPQRITYIGGGGDSLVAIVASIKSRNQSPRSLRVVYRKASP